VNSQVATTEGFATDWRSNVSEFYIGYSHRFVHNADLNTFARLGLGGATIRIANDSNVNQETFSSGIVDLQLGFQHTFSRVKAGIWFGNYYWGAAVNASHFTGSEPMKNGTKFDGSTGSGLLFIGVGL